MLLRVGALCCGAASLRLLQPGVTKSTKDVLATKDTKATMKDTKDDRRRAAKRRSSGVRAANEPPKDLGAVAR